MDLLFGKKENNSVAEVAAVAEIFRHFRQKRHFRHIVFDSLHSLEYQLNAYWVDKQKVGYRSATDSPTM